MDTPKDIQEITTVDLPLSCPMPSDSSWNNHPRIYLPIKKIGMVTCPYCGTVYRLVAQQD